MIGNAAKRIMRFFATIVFLVPILSFADSGTFNMTAVLSHSYMTIDNAGTTYTGGWLNGYTVINESTGNLFETGQVYDIRCIVYSHGTREDLELSAPCEWTNANGGKLVTMSGRSDSGVSEGQTGDGSMKFLRGTGELEGIEGSCVYTISYLPDSMAVSNLSCEWKRN